MKLIKKVTLRTQLILVVIMIMLVMLIIQFFYYFNFFSLMQQDARRYTGKLIEQIEYRVEIISQNIRESTEVIAYNKFIQEYMAENDVEKKFDQFGYVSSFCDSITSSNKMVRSVLILSLNGKILFSNEGNMIQPTLNKAFSDYNVDVRNLEKPLFTGVYSLAESKERVCFYFYPINFYLNNAAERKRIGMCVVLCDADVLEFNKKDYDTTDMAAFFIMDSKDEVISSNIKDYNSEDLKKFVSVYGRKPGSGVYNNKSVDIHVKPFEYIGWKAVAVIFKDDLNKGVLKIVKTGIMIGMVSAVFLTVFVIILVGRNITRPIKSITEFIQKVGIGNKRNRLVMEYRNEIGVISGYINSMLDNIEATTSRIVKTQAELYETELKKNMAELSAKSAELSALQSQINPHFLYNTLECIRSYAFLSDIIEIEDMASSLADIFRYSIGGGMTAFIGDELECVKNYINIIKIRFQERISLEIDVQEALYKTKVIKMLLQPLVENAVYHGLEPKSGKGRVSITGRCNGDIIELWVTDNGIGMDHQEYEKLVYNLNNDLYKTESNDGKRSIGLANINSRMKIAYGESFGIKVYSIVNQGTQVLVSFPADDSKIIQSTSNLLHTPQNESLV